MSSRRDKFFHSIKSWADARANLPDRQGGFSQEDAAKGQPKVVSAVSLLGNEGGFFVFDDIKLQNPVTGANLIQTGI